MDLFFLACFAFGALFTLVSALLGLVGSAFDGHGLVGHHPAGDVGAHGGQGHALPHAHAHLHGHGHLPLHVEPARAPAGGHGPAAHEAETSVGHGLGVPLLNASSLLAFLTWFGAAGYLLLAVAGWPLLLVLPVAILAGLAAALLIGLFLGKIIAGERVMDPRAYRLEGTVARVTVSIPAGGVGEIVFTKAGARRSEAARSLSGRAIPRETEVVIVDYERGVAAVQTLDELVRPSRLGPSGPEDAGALPGT